MALATRYWVIMNNIIFCFSGTGNSLKAAKTIAASAFAEAESGNTEIVSMAKLGKYTLSKKYDTVGFIYPVYAWGLPKKVAEFAANLDLTSSKNAYFYSVATHGGQAGNGVYQMYELLHKRHGIKMNYGQDLKMFSNYVIMSDMKKNVNEITEKSNAALVPIVDSIKSRQNKSTNKLTKIFHFFNKMFINNVSNMDKHYNVNDACTACSICVKVCPVKNIELLNNRPKFNNKCEQCVACIQYCPVKAINYKNLTQKRGRYTNPKISFKTLSEFNNL